MLTPPVQLAADDYDDICRLWAAAGLSFRPVGRDSPEAFAAQLSSGVQTALGMYDNGHLIGVVVATHDSRKGWINRLAVHPDYRRQGIGAALIAACQTHLEQQAIQVVAALIERDNLASLALFQREGYHLHQDVCYLTRRPPHAV